MQTNYNQALETWNMKFQNLVEDAKRRPDAISIPRLAKPTRMTYTTVKQQETQQQQQQVTQKSSSTQSAAAEEGNDYYSMKSFFYFSPLAMFITIDAVSGSSAVKHEASLVPPRVTTQIKTLTNWLSPVKEENTLLPTTSVSKNGLHASSSSSSSYAKSNSNSLMSSNSSKAKDIIRAGRALVLSNQQDSSAQSSIVYNSFIPRIEPIPYCWSWVPIKSNCVAEDETILRALPYFGDNDTTGVDISEFDQVPGELEEEVLGEAEEQLIIHMLERHKRANGIKPEVYSAISTALKYSNSEEEENISYSEICKAYERVTDGPWYRIHWHSQNILAEERRLSLTEVGMHDQSSESLKPLLDLHGSDGVFFDVDSARHLQTGVGFGMGILNVGRYETLIGNYRDFFCRRCYTYNCAEHGVEHPIPAVRTDPEPPFLCPVPKLTLPTDKLRLQLREHHLPPSFTDGSRLSIEQVDLSSLSLKQQLGANRYPYNGSSTSSPRAQESSPRPKTFADSFYYHNGQIMCRDPVTGEIEMQLQLHENVAAWIDRPPPPFPAIGKDSDADAMDVEGEEQVVSSKVSSSSSSRNKLQPATSSSQPPVHSNFSLPTNHSSSDSNSLHRQDPSTVYRPQLQVSHPSISPDAPEHALIPKPEQQPKASLPGTEARIVAFQYSFSPPLVDSELALLFKFRKMHTDAASRRTSSKSSVAELLPLNEYMQRLLGTRKQEEIDRVLANPWVFQRFGNIAYQAPSPGKASSKSKTVLSPAALAARHPNAMDVDDDDNGEEEVNADEVEQDFSYDMNVKSKGTKGRKKGSGGKVKLNTTNKNSFNTFYQPCNHEGDCSKDTNCICVVSGTFCEKYCACSRNCSHKFQGCNCKNGACRTKSCPCFAASRACDPDLCGVCGAGVHPAFLPAVQHFLHLQQQQQQQTISDDGDDGTSSVAPSTSFEQQLFCLPVTSSTASNNGYYDPNGNGNSNVEGKRRGRPVAGARSEICSNLPFRVRHKHRLLIGRSEAQGYGAFASERIGKGEFIAEYRGEIISQAEAERRGLIYDKHDISFLFETNKDQVIDATRKGNKARFINHRTENPNCIPKIMQIDGDHRVGIFACQDLDPSEELFFDYGYKNHAKEWAKAGRHKNIKEKVGATVKVVITGKKRGRTEQQVVTGE